MFDCPFLSVEEHMLSRTLPGSILPPAAGAGLLLQRPWWDPDPRAWRLQTLLPC